MKRSLICAALLALSLATSCTTSPTSTTTSIVTVDATKVFQLKSTYAIARSGLVVYRSLPYCPVKKPVCQEKAIAIQIQKADAVALANMDALEKAVRINGSVDFASYQGALLAVNAVQTLDQTYGKH